MIFYKRYKVVFSTAWVFCWLALDMTALAIDKSARPRGQFKGYAAIEEFLANNYFNNFDFHLGRLIGIDSRDQASSLAALLGEYQGVGANQSYVNGSPNALNTFLWDAFVVSTAQAVGKICQEGQNVTHNGTTLYFKEEFFESIRELCQNPYEADLLSLWELLIGYEAYDEFPHWEAYATNLIQNWEVEDPSDLVASLTYTVLFNPYFLLEP